MADHPFDVDFLKGRATNGSAHDLLIVDIFRWDPDLSAHLFRAYVAPDSHILGIPFSLLSSGTYFISLSRVVRGTGVAEHVGTVVVRRHKTDKKGKRWSVVWTVAAPGAAIEARGTE